MELLVRTRKGLPDSRSRLTNLSAPEIGMPSWISTPSMSVSQDSMGLRSAMGKTPLGTVSWSSKILGFSGGHASRNTRNTRNTEGIGQLRDQAEHLGPVPSCPP